MFLRFALPLALLASTACASVERGRFGVARLRFEGMEQLDERPLRECLLTRERERLSIRLGVSAPLCNEPPFDAAAPELGLWRWPWTEWPSFNRAVFDHDVERILRYYRARGFYEAKVEQLSFEPELAATGTCRDDDCTVSIRVLIREGEFVRVQAVELETESDRALAPALLARLQAVIELRAGERFDETDYDRSKAALQRVLREAAFARAAVQGTIHVDRAAKSARVVFRLAPGETYRFRSLELRGQRNLPAKPIIAAAGFEKGALYHPDKLSSLRNEVFALGAFSAVEIEERLDRAAGAVDLVLQVTPQSPHELRLGFGVTSGANRRTETGELESIPQWDLHLFGRYERRHVFGTLGALRIEERPRLIYSREFPNYTTPDLGNILSVRINQPGLVESRTDLFAQTTWDYGPDPFLGFTRSDIIVRSGLRRGFFARRLLGTLALQQDLFVVPDSSTRSSDGSLAPQSYRYAFLEQDLRLELRDQPLSPSRGAYFALNASASPRSFASDWSTLRLIPDARAYLPLPFGSVFAVRGALGALFVLDASDRLDEPSQQLGPTSYRLRGGGANSVRGFLPGRLGAGLQGGLRRWEATGEWRVRLGSSFSVVGFLDFGDVNAARAFRFAHLNTSAGFGLRYLTIVGPIRLDAGFRVRRWQRADGSNGIADDANDFPFTNKPGALHLTIGESF